MRLLELDIKGFGLLKHQHIEFGEGINIIYGRNEAGKSTLHTFIKAMLYGLERSRGIAKLTDTWARYEPWMDKGCYEGVMKLVYDEQIYVIERNFVANAPVPLRITNETTGMPVKPEEEFLDTLMCGLTESGFANTISIGQLKSSGDEGMYNELRRYITNINTTAAKETDTGKAIEYLQSQKKAFQDQIVPEAAKAYTANLTEIKNLEGEISSPEYGRKLTTIQEQTTNTSQRAQELQARKEVLIEQVSGKKQMLSGSGFESKDSIVQYMDELEEAREDCRQAVQKGDFTSYRLGAIIFGFLGAFFSIFGVYMLITGEGNPVSAALRLQNAWASGICILLAIISFILAAWLSNRYNTSTAMQLQAYDFLEDLYRERNFDAELSEENDEQIDARLAEYKEMFREIAESEREIADIAEEQKKISMERDDITKTLEEHQISQWELEKQLEHLSNLKDETAALKRVISENERIQFEVDAISLAQDLISHLSVSIKNSFGTYLNKQASELVSGITGGVYTSIFIDDELNIFLNTKDRLVPLEQISRGTMDQIYLALRLAVAKLLANDSGDELPFLFDDSFANYDEKRLRSAFRWLSNTFGNRQMLIFSCHKREAQMLTSQQIDFRLIELKN